FARQAINIASTGDNETLNRFANGGNVRGIFSNGKGVAGFGEYQDKELQQTAIDIDSRFSGGEHIVSLPGQVDFKQISL
ncbi:CamS family sex pheromone protein, partial [Veillonella nakazawae]